LGAAFEVAGRPRGCRHGTPRGQGVVGGAHLGGESDRISTIPDRVPHPPTGHESYYQVTPQSVH
jgi:hypothetical protein